MFFKNTSIKNKLRIVILLTSTLVLCLSTTAFVMSELFAFRRDIVNNLFVLADLVGINSTAGLLFDNDETAKENIIALEANPHIVLAHVFSKEGKLFVSYSKQGAEAKKSYKFTNVYDYYAYHDENNSKKVRDSYFFEDEHIDIFKKIMFKDQLLGVVFIQADLDTLNERLAWGIIIIIAVFLLSSILAFLLASYFQRVITVPIDELLKIMKLTSKTQNYSHRAKKMTSDEMGTLVDGFNKMLSQIETGTHELGKARDQAMAANKAKSIFLANMSHELRTPLNGILGFAQILKTDQELNADQKSGVEVIHQSGEHLLSLITDILDLSKIEADRIELSPLDFRLDTFLKNIIDLFKMRCKTKGLTFVYEELSHLPKSVHADEKRLRQILINLLGNAIKFTTEGKVTLKVGYHNEKTRFQVEDTGAGISKEEENEIFKPFQQVGDKTLHAEGTGLGLTITKKLVEMMGGKLHVESELGKGTIFWLTVDLPKIDDVDEYEDTSIIVGFKEPGYRILVADDKDENRHFLINLLMPLGFEIVEAVNGIECVDKAHEWHPDLILMDLIMPFMDGFEATQTIKQSVELQDIIIIMVTASAFEWHKQKSADVGCNDFIAKPVSIKELLQTLGKYLKLTWNYKIETGNQALGGKTSFSDSQSPIPIGPSGEQAEILLDLVMMGDVCGIVEEVEKFEKNHENLRPFADKIRLLSKNYEMGNIQRLIECYVEDDEGHKENSDIPLEPEEQSIVGPSKEQSAILLDFAKMGDLDSLIEHIETYEQYDKKLSTFANDIREFAQNFEINAIRIYIENYIKNK